VASVVVTVADCLMEGCLEGKSHIIEKASFKEVTREMAAIGVLSFLVKNRSLQHKVVVISFINCSLRKVEVH
jgi:hypothetical protein